MLEEKLKDFKKKINYASQIINCEIPDDLNNQVLVDQLDWFLYETIKIWEEIKIDESIKITEGE